MIAVSSTTSASSRDFFTELATEAGECALSIVASSSPGPGTLTVTAYSGCRPCGVCVIAGVDRPETGVGCCRWEPPASAGGSDAPASRKESTFINRALAPASRRRPPRLKPEENSSTRAARLQSRAPPHECGGSHQRFGQVWLSAPSTSSGQALRDSVAKLL
jgi:hypothetical protein